MILVAPPIRDLAHVVHWTILLGGLLGVALLLAPHVLGRRSTSAPRDAHERRVATLRRDLGLAPPAAPRTPATPAVLLPVAVTSSLAGATVHAAVCPDHFAEGTAVGLVLAAAALGQTGWAFLAARRTSPLLLAAALAGNLALLALWAWTRVVGIPFGLGGPEPLGPWDLAAVAFEGVTAASVLLLLVRGADGQHLARWREWSSAARGWGVLSMAVLVGLSLAGVGS